MILPNVHKFVFEEDMHMSLRNLVQKCTGSENVIFCPKFGTIFAWWIPNTSPNSEEGGWSKLKHIEVSGTPVNYNVSLWDKTQAPQDIKEMVDRHYDCYLVPMKDVHYSAIMGDGVNFKVFVEHDFTFYSTNVTDKPENFMVKSVAVRSSMNNTYVNTLYRLTNNMVEYHVAHTDMVEPWTSIDEEEPDWNMWVSNLVNSSDSGDPVNSYETEYPEFRTPERLDMPLEPGTPKKDDVAKNLSVEFEGTHGEDVELSSGSEGFTDGNIAEGVPVDKPESTDDSEESADESTEDEDYEPSNDSDSSYDDFDKYEEYDEMRQDLNGGWYTRRQFYDYYGSDEAWDNLDPSIYQRMRYDENCDEWFTKEQFFQWYGSNIVWKKMNPKMQLKRMRLCGAYSWASYLPHNLQDSFIGDYMRTYKMIDKSSYMKKY